MRLKPDLKAIKSARLAIDFVQSQVPKAFTSAINRVGQGVKTEASRKIRETYRIRSSDVSKYGNIRVTRASPERMQLLLTSRGRNIPLIRFATSPNKPPDKQPKVLKASVKREGGRKPIPGAFVARMRSGHVGVFERAGKSRTPIEEKYGPAVPVMLNNPEITQHLMDEAQRRMKVRLDHEMNRVHGRMKSK